MPRTLIALRPAALRATLLAAALGATYGCTLSPLAKRTAAFATAAAKTTRQTTTAYDTVERAFYQAQVSRLVNRYDQSGFDPASVQPFLPEHDREVRTRILRGLHQYAELLAEISSDKPLAAMDKQAKAVGSSLQGLSADQLSSAHLSATELNAAATAIDALGRTLIETRRRRELPGLLHTMQEPIEHICELLRQDIGTPKGSGLRNQLAVSYTNLVRQEQLYIDANKGSMTPTEKRAEIRTLPHLVLSGQQADAALATTASSLERLARAHTALAETARLKDSPAFRLQLSELIDEADQLGTFFNALPSD